MPRLRFQRAAVDKSEGLLDAATHEFATQGYEDASINRILLAAGFSKGSFYYYFDDKVDLAIAVLERWAKHHIHLWDFTPLPATAEEFWARHDAMMERAIACMRDVPTAAMDAMVRLGAALARHPEIRDRLTAVVCGLMTNVHAFWEAGQKVGAVRTDMSMSALVALIQDTKLTLVRLALPSDRPATREELEAFTRLHIDMVRRLTERR